MAEVDPDRKAVLKIRGRTALVAWWDKRGPRWEPKPALAKATPAEKEMAAYWLSGELSGLSQDDCYELLFET